MKLINHLKVFSFLLGTLFILIACQATNDNYLPEDRYSTEDNTSQAISTTEYTTAPQYIPVNESGQKAPQTLVQESDAPLTNYGETNLPLLSAQLLALNSQKSTQATTDTPSVVHIVQIGDSHTAADFFSGQLRKRLQNDFGDAGIGFVNPVKVSGQRYANLSVEHNKATWGVLSSRVDSADNFTMGGFIATPMAYEPEDDNEEKNQEDLDTQTSLTMKLWTPNNQTYHAKALYQARDDASLIFVDSANMNKAPALQARAGDKMALPATKNAWQFSPEQSIKFPVKVLADTGSDLKLAGWYIRNNKPGVIFSTLGINGATIAMLDKWQSSWIDDLAQLKPNMVILAYGTNEAFNDDLDLQKYEQRLRDKVLLIRDRLPDAVILMIGPNDSIKNKPETDFATLSSQEISEQCQAMQAKNLAAVMSIQKKIAQEQKTLYWDWQKSMGGDCSIIDWNKEDKAQNDLVHLSIEGYYQSGDDFYNDLKPLLLNKN